MPIESWRETPKGWTLSGWEWELHVERRKSKYRAHAAVCDEDEGLKKTAQTGFVWKTIGDAQRASSALRDQLSDNPPPRVYPMKPGEERIIHTAALPPVSPKIWDPWSKNVTVDPGGTAIFGPGPYLKIPFWHCDDEDDGMRDRVRCPYGYVENYLFASPNSLIEVVDVQLEDAPESPRPMTPWRWRVTLRGVEGTEPDTRQARTPDGVMKFAGGKILAIKAQRGDAP